MTQLTEQRPLEGRVALVTGSARNIGKAIALRLAAEGAAVVIHARTSQEQVNQVVEEIRAAGGKATGCLGDVTDEGAVERLIDHATAAFGALDILVNNAAIRRESSLGSTSLQEWKYILSTILDGAFLCARAAAPHLMRSSAGTIVNIGGMTGSSGGSDRIHVVTGKAGLIGLTKALAWDLADHGVTVNLVSPGMIDTRRDTSTATAVPRHRSVHAPLLGRKGTAEEIAGVVRMLCTPDGRFITGQTIHINGGAYLA